MPSLYLYRIHPSRPAMLTDGRTPEEEAIIAEHFTYLERLTVQGTVLLAGRTLTPGAESFGIVVLTAETEETARNVMTNDPAIRKGVMFSDFFPFRISLISPTLLALGE
jgi:uncharacterized protein YciI